MLLFLILNSYVTVTGAISSGECRNKYSLDIRGESNNGYFTSLGLGTPPQNVTLLIDTSDNSFLLYPSSNNGSHLFSFKMSRTFETMHESVPNDGGWSSFLGKDQLHLCPGVSHALSMQFICITSDDIVFEETTKWDGIIGLARGVIAAPSIYNEPFLETLVSSGTPNLFSLSLCGPFLYSKEEISTDGQMHLGYKNTEFYDGKIMYTPVLKETHYEVMIAGLKVGENELDIPCSEFNDYESTIHSRSSFLAFPEKIYNWVIKQLQSQTESRLVSFPEEFWSQQAVECFRDSQKINLFPFIKLSLFYSFTEKFTLVITPDLYLVKAFKPGYDLCLKLAICPTTRGTVIGATVLRGFYVIFDRSKKRIGFANSTCKEMSAIPSNFRPIVTLSEHSSADLWDCVYNSYSYFAFISTCLASTLTCIFLLMVLYFVVRCAFAYFAHFKKTFVAEKDLEHDIIQFELQLDIM